MIVIAPSPNDHLSLLEAIEELQLQALIPELCSEMAASLQASAMLLPWASCTSIWRSLAMIYSGVNLFFGMGFSLVPNQSSQSTWSNSTQSGHLRSTQQVCPNVTGAYLGLGKAKGWLPSIRPLSFDQHIQHIPGLGHDANLSWKFAQFVWAR